MHIYKYSLHSAMGNALLINVMGDDAHVTDIWSTANVSVMRDLEHVNVVWDAVDVSVNCFCKCQCY